MLKKILLPTVLILLAYGFWVSPDFKEIASGVAIFLFGMLFLEEGFKAYTGGLLEKILKNTTNTTMKSLGFGIVSTSLMQSSSLVSVITISFLSAGLITLAAGIGIIFGANLGTTTGAWLIAGFGLKVKISAYAMPMLVFGIMLVFQKSKKLNGAGYILAGLGFLFLGIHHMKEGFEAFRETVDLTRYALSGYSGVFLYAMLGIIATVIMQSSHATLVIIITALSAQQIAYENALALAIGANIGTTITAILGSMSSNIDGKRLAGAHLIFNMATGIIAIAFIYQIAQLVDVISNVVGISADDYMLKLAVFHSIFNALGVLIMLPFINALVTFLIRYMPDKSAKDRTAPKYLHESASELPDTAIESVRKETIHLYENAFTIIAHGIGLHRHDIRSTKDMAAVVRDSIHRIPINIDDQYDKYIKGLYGDIVSFISRASQTMTPEQAEVLYTLRTAGRDIVDAIKDTKHMHKNLSHNIESGNKYIKTEYNKLRIGVGLVLRSLEMIKDSESDLDGFISMEEIKIEIEKRVREVNKNLDSLIRGGFITPEMATSLMNDAAYSYDVAHNLVNMAEVLFNIEDDDIREAEQSILLDKGDVDDIVESGEKAYEA